jgi:hypothetical protein
MPRLSSTSEAAGMKSEPSPTERTNPSSTRISGIPLCSAASASPTGAREAQTAMLPRGLRPAAASAAFLVCRKVGVPPLDRRKSRTCRRFQTHPQKPSQGTKSPREPTRAHHRRTEATRRGLAVMHWISSQVDWSIPVSRRTCPVWILIWSVPSVRR